VFDGAIRDQLSVDPINLVDLKCKVSQSERLDGLIPVYRAWLTPNSAAKLARSAKNRSRFAGAKRQANAAMVKTDVTP